MLAGRALGTIARYLFAFIVPGNALLYVWSGPHGYRASLAFLAVPILFGFADAYGAPDREPPLPAAGPSWWFDGLLYALSAVQVATILGLPWMLRNVPLLSADSIVAILIVGGASGYCGLVVAHEWIHRRSRRHRLVGRALLCTALYDHFHIEHIAVHHARVATLDDPTTARFGESFAAFLVRTIRGQIGGAWRLERKRLTSRGVSSRAGLVIGHAMTHGVIIYVALAAGMAWLGGLTSLVVFLGQALDAVVLLQAVNYFEHYGLLRSDKRVRHVDSWDADSWLSRVALVGISRHADHHVDSTRPYYRLQAIAESPKLPYGYMGMAYLTLFRNHTCRELLARELRAKRLGPFAAAAAGEMEFAGR